MTRKYYKIGDFLTRSKKPVKIKPQEEYTLVTIRMYHNGVAKRSHVKGSSIKSQTLYKVHAGQFILSGIDARNRAFGIVPVELDGAVVTNDFWTHDIDTSIIDVNFFYWFTTTPQFHEACIKASEGTTNRQRLQADKFYSFNVLLPSISEQQELAERIAYIQNRYGQLDKELGQQQTYLQLLRKTILQEALEGKLKTQHSADEPATELLKNIKAKKIKLTKAKRLNNEKLLPQITKDEFPFELPKRWEFERIGNLMNLINGRAFKPTEWSSKGLPIVRIQNLNSEIAPFNYHESPVDERFLINDNDLLIGWSGTPGTSFGAFIWRRGKAILNQHIFKVEQYGDLISVEFLQLAINSRLSEMISKAHGGVGLQHITKGKFEMIPLPIPPFAEQQRIVKKVQQLQHQLTQLDAQVKQSREYAQQLLKSVLKEVFEGKGQPFLIKLG